MTGPPSAVFPGPPDYTYAAVVTGVIDGATVMADIGLGHIGPGLRSAQDVDFGFGVRRTAGWLIMRRPIRLAGIQTFGTAKAELEKLVTPNGKILIRSLPTDSLRFVLADVWRYGETVTLAQLLVDAGVADLT